MKTESEDMKADLVSADDQTVPGEFPRRAETAGGSCSAWSVEARCNLPQPREICGMLLSDRWQKITFRPGTPGVPDGPQWHEGRAFGLLSYPAAQALRWWFLADADANMKDHGLETRIVRHAIKYERSATPTQAVDAVSWAGVARVTYGGAS